MMLLFGFLPIVLIALGFNAFKALRWVGGKRLEFGETQGNRITQRNRIDATLFRLAKRQRGRITLSDVVIETGMDIEKAERHLDTMVDQIHVSVDLDERGSLVYVFPELLGDTGG